MTTLPSMAALFLAVDQFWWANVCFTLTALFLLAKIIQAAVTSTDAAWHRILFTFLLCGLVGVALAETIRGVNHRASRKYALEAKLESPAPSHKNSASPQPDRIFLPPDVDCEFLTGLYRKDTSVHADSILANYLGKWMKLSVVVRDVSKRGDSYVMSSIVDGAGVGMTFRAEWADRLSVIRNGSTVNVIGKLAAVESHVVELNDCELVGNP